MRAADINGDGRIDLLGTAAADNQLVWYENPGDPARDPWTKHVIDTPYRPAHGHPVDMDGDGDLDVVMALGYAGPKEGRDPACTRSCGTRTRAVPSVRPGRSTS